MIKATIGFICSMLQALHSENERKEAASLYVLNSTACFVRHRRVRDSRESQEPFVPGKPAEADVQDSKFQGSFESSCNCLPISFAACHRCVYYYCDITSCQPLSLHAILLNRQIYHIIISLPIFSYLPSAFCTGTLGGNILPCDPMVDFCFLDLFSSIL